MTMWVAHTLETLRALWPFYSIVNNQSYCVAWGLQALPESNLHTDRASCVLSAQGGFCLFCIRVHVEMRDVNFFHNKQLY